MIEEEDGIFVNRRTQIWLVDKGSKEFSYKSLKIISIQNLSIAEDPLDPTTIKHLGRGSFSGSLNW